MQIHFYPFIFFIFLIVASTTYAQDITTTPLDPAVETTPLEDVVEREPLLKKEEAPEEILIEEEPLEESPIEGLEQDEEIAAPEPEETDDDELPIELGANFRSYLIHNDNYSFPPYFAEQGGQDTTSANYLRLTAKAKPIDHVTGEAHVVQTAVANTDIVPPKSPTAHRYHVDDLEWTQEDDKRLRTSLYADRALVNVVMDKADLTVGRQPITFGKAFFWNPLDIFRPFDPAKLDRDYKPGVDALRLDVPIDNFSGLNVIGAAGRRYGDEDVSWDGSALIGRGFTSLKGWDVSGQGGKVYGGHHLGTGFTGEIENIQLRGELSKFYVDEDFKNIIENHRSIVLGVGRYFENTVNVQAEYFYNGAGQPDHLDLAAQRVRQGFTTNMSRHLVGASVSYDFHPLVVGRISGIVSLNDHSYQIQPDVRINFTDDMDFIIAAIFNHGQRPGVHATGQAYRRSEFGSYPDTFLAELKFYF